MSCIGRSCTGEVNECSFNRSGPDEKVNFKLGNSLSMNATCAYQEIIVYIQLLVQ